MRPQLLKTFLAVTRRRNITRAAAEVHLAQSSVSDQIQMLETEVGAPLFIRTKTGLDLTPAGMALQPYAGDILALIAEARQAVETAAGHAATGLTIGTLETIAAVRMPGWLAAIEASQPGLPLTVSIGASGDLSRRLDDGEIDLLIGFDRSEHDTRRLRRVLADEPLVLIAQPGKTIVHDLEPLARERFVATAAGCVYRHLFDQTFTDAGLSSPPLAAEVGSLRAIVRLVAAGTGLALLPRLAVTDALEAGDVVEHPWPGVTRSVPLVATWRRRTQALASALAVMKEAVRPGDVPPRHATQSRS